MFDPFVEHVAKGLNVTEGTVAFRRPEIFEDGSHRGAMEPESFFHVALKVEDIDECATFYREHFDAELLERGDADSGAGATAVNYAALEVADKRVYLFDRAPYEAAGLSSEIPPGFLHFGFVVDDIDQAHQELTAAGIDFIMEPSVFGDLKIAFFADPAGVRIELLEHRHR
jgi:catechol 2,3-dioxygenase-like lactoylglutathione lyase family enzyme